ncbi:uncharacterized protein LOC135112550 [Scylla paramamosain]|uniref:uncharacterized protein LOC135112550 n=1 Tax=Scylla paramamosain TaxID=85552 RepID=UPI003082B380
MAVFYRRPRHALCLLLLLFGILLSHVNTALVMKTSSGSESEVLLPDGQEVVLLFWVEDTRGEALSETKEMEERDDFTSEEENKKEKKKKKRLRDVEEEEERNHDDHEAALATSGENSTITLTYLVSGFQYPTLRFKASERNVWLSALFNYNRVHIPAGSLMLNPVPPSWWGRKVKVSSEPSVYWYLCPSPNQCAPGNPPHLYSGNAIPVSVIALGTTSVILLLLCLGQVALVLHLRRKSRHAKSRHQLSRADTIDAHRFTTRC